MMTIKIEIAQNPFKLHRAYSSEFPILNIFLPFSSKENASKNFHSAFF